MNPFERFQDLFQLEGKSKKYKSKLYDDALAWFKDEFGGEFGSPYVCTDKGKRFLWYYTTGMLMFSVGKVGSYYFSFIVKAIMFKYLKTPSYRIGFKYGSTKGIKHDRDANPYSAYDFYNTQAWDCGYIMGLYNEKLKEVQDGK